MGLIQNAKNLWLVIKSETNKNANTGVRIDQAAQAEILAFDTALKRLAECLQATNMMLGNCIITGCVFSITAINYSTKLANWKITAGYVFINGKLIKVDETIGNGLHLTNNVPAPNQGYFKVTLQANGIYDSNSDFDNWSEKRAIQSFEGYMFSPNENQFIIAYWSYNYNDHYSSVTPFNENPILKLANVDNKINLALDSYKAKRLNSASKVNNEGYAMYEFNVGISLGTDFFLISAKTTYTYNGVTSIIGHATQDDVTWRYYELTGILEVHFKLTYNECGSTATALFMFK